MGQKQSCFLTEYKIPEALLEHIHRSIQSFENTLAKLVLVLRLGVTQHHDYARIA